MARHKPIKVNEKPSYEEIAGYWDECFAPARRRKNGTYTNLQSRVWDAYYKSTWANTDRKMLDGLLNGGYLEMAQPEPVTQAGAEEYDLLMKGAKAWASIQKNSGN